MVFAPESLILTNNFLPLSEALGIKDLCMNKEVYLLLDTALKIGLGAIITGFSAYILSIRNHKNDRNKKIYEDRGLLIKELAFKFEEIESCVNEVVMHLSLGNIEKAKIALMPASQNAYAARAISNLIGSDNLVNDIEVVCLITEKLFQEVNSTDSSISNFDKLTSQLKENKLKIYPHIREAYLKN